MKSFRERVVWETNNRVCLEMSWKRRVEIHHVLARGCSVQAVDVGLLYGPCDFGRIIVELDGI